MVQKNFTLKNEIGLHARPASNFVKTAATFKSEVTFIKDEKEYNGKSIISVLSIGAVMGTELTLQISGIDEEVAIEALTQVIENMN